MNKNIRDNSEAANLESSGATPPYRIVNAADADDVVVSAVADEPTALSKDSDAQWVRGLGIDVTASPPTATAPQRADVTEQTAARDAAATPPRPDVTAPPPHPDDKKRKILKTA